MQKLQAQNIVRETLQDDFNRERFIRFIKELLNSYEEAPFVYRGNIIPDAYDKYISTLERVGKYFDGENKIDVLIVKLKKDTSLQRARTAQRNFVAWYLNGSRGGDYKDAALVAFVSPNEVDWRFSLIKMDYKFHVGKNGKTKVKEEFTPARRWSFLVGPNEHSHTAQARLAPIIEDENIITMARLEEAFNIEKVTEEFFEKYRGLFADVKEAMDRIIASHADIRSGFAEKSVTSVDFSKRLIGQVVFLYFLQKKGWFGVPQNKEWGEGDKNFIRNLFKGEYLKYKNFYNEILEPLFYDALALDRSHLDHWNDHFQCKIPFLNGGLFDNKYNWHETEIELPNDLFSNEYLTKEKDKGTGILDIFDRYNFTVKEDEPLEKEVAVDPEMLGKVFENLLEVKDRKSKGTYYTPREIVKYMCQQSILNYLFTSTKIKREKISRLILKDNLPSNEAVIHSLNKLDFDELEKAADKAVFLRKDEAKELDSVLASIKIADPACGSGAFLIGMLNEIVEARRYLHLWFVHSGGINLAELKRQVIENSIFGVDIDPGAVEIAKLRLWLSLVVDEADIKQIKPLPNLDYKIMQGNSLLEEFEGIKLFDEKLLNATLEDNSGKTHDIEKQLSAISSKLMKFYQTKPEWLRDKSIERPSELAVLESEQKRLMGNLKLEKDKGKINVNEVINSSLFHSENISQNIWKMLNSLHEDFFEETQKSKKDNIKRQIEQLEWELIEATLKEQSKTSALTKLEEFKQSNTKPFFLWRLNFADVFEEKGGFDVVIANPPYIGEKGHKEMFREIKHGSLGNFYQGKMDLFYFFFHLALNIGNDTSQSSFISTNYYSTALGGRKLRADLKNRAIIKQLVDFNELKVFQSAMGQHNMITILSKGQNENFVAKTCITKRTGIATPTILENIVSRQDEKTNYFEVAQKDLYDGEENYIRIQGIRSSGGNLTNLVLNKLGASSSLLGEVCAVNIGMITGANKVSQNYIDAYDLHLEKGLGIYVITDEERIRLHLSQNEEEMLLPFFKNSDIKKYFCETENNLWLIDLSYPKFKDVKWNSIPHIRDHIWQFKKILQGRRSNDNGLQAVINTGYWWCYTMRQLDFHEEKIVSPQRSVSNTFAFSSSHWVASMDVYFITQNDKSLSLKFVLALLNSRLYYFWLYHRGKRKGETLELYQKPLSEIPIKKISPDKQKPFINLVDKILAITKSSNYLENLVKQAKVKEYEKQINKLVYKLYDLTPEEIKIVEDVK